MLMSVERKTVEARPEQNWSRYRYPESLIRFSVLLGVLVFIVYSLDFLNIDMKRLAGAFPRFAELLATRYFPPDLVFLPTWATSNRCCAPCRCRCSAA
jgi:phosphonate transport system permease protein